MVQEPVVSVGAILGDSDAESMAWARLIGALSEQVQASVAGVSSPVSVSIAFHVDGRLVPNEFEGVRTGRFDERRSLLVVQAAVPRDAPGDRAEVLRDLLDESVTEAERYLREKGLLENLTEIREAMRNADRR